MRLIDRIFHLEEINGHNACPTYLYRWRLLKVGKWFSVYVHHFVGDDWSRDMHDHPRRFVSIGLKGRYVEETPSIGNGPVETEYRAPWCRSFPPEHVHRIRLYPGEKCWTLVIVLQLVRPWGFWHLGEWTPWKQYVNSDTAKEMKSCP